MQNKFFFDYIYYRMTKLYFKWDGRTGFTAIIGISMIQILLVVDIVVFAIRLFYERSQTKNYIEPGKWIVVTFCIAVIAYNYRKYDGTYNKLRFHWKDEPNKLRILKGVLVVLSLAIPWVPIILIGILM